LIKVLLRFLEKHFKSFIYTGSTLMILLSVYFISLLPQLKFDSNFENFFPKRDSSAAFYFEHRKLFGSDNDFILLGLEFKDSVLKRENLLFIHQLCESIDSIDQVKNALSISNFTYPIIESFGIIEVPYINLENDESTKQTITQLKVRPDLIASFLSKDANKTLIIINHKKIESKIESDGMIDDLMAKIEFYRTSNFHLAGKLIAEKSYLSETIKELSFFVALSILLVTLYLWFTYRSFVGVIVPLLVVLFTIIATVGTMVFFGKQLDIMTVLMPCILFVVSMSDVIHIITEYEYYIQQNHNPQVAIIKTFKKVGLATFLTTLTTAFAFATLKLSIIKPIGDFGLYSAIGVSFAYLFTIFFLPLMLIHFKIKIITRKTNSKDFLTKLLNKINHTINFKKKQVLVVAIIATLISLFGTSQLSINDTMLNDLSDDHPTKQDLNFFNNNFGGLRIFEVQFEALKDSSILSYDAITALEKVENKLAEKGYFSSVISPVAIMKTFNQAFHSGDFSYFKIPASKTSYQTLYEKSKPYLNQKLIREFTANQQQLGRLTARQVDLGSKLSLIEKSILENEMRSIVKQSDISFRITGSSDLIDQNNLSLSKNLFQSLGLNILLLVLLVSVLFKSFKLGLIAMVCNVLPILFIAGVMGFAGIDLSVSISIIFTIAFGIAVDDTIHFLSRYKIETLSGKANDETVKITLYNTGKAMIRTTFVIAAGFGVLMFSQFKSTSLIGFMVTITLITALLCDLILLPVLLKYSFKTFKNQV